MINRWVACFHAVAGKHVLAEACLRPGGEGMAPIISAMMEKWCHMFPFNLFDKWTPERARERLQKGRAPSRMRVTGRLNLANAGWLTCLPRKLEAEAIDVSGCARLSELPEKLKCAEFA